MRLKFVRPCPPAGSNSEARFERKIWGPAGASHEPSACGQSIGWRITTTPVARIDRSEPRAQARGCRDLASKLPPAGPPIRHRSADSPRGSPMTSRLWSFASAACAHWRLSARPCHSAGSNSVARLVPNHLAAPAAASHEPSACGQSIGWRITTSPCSRAGLRLIGREEK